MNNPTTRFQQNPFRGDFDSTRPLIQDNIVRVLRMEDFPDPVSGVITLASNTKYIIDAPLTTSDRFEIPELSQNEIESSFLGGNTITYTGTGTFITGTNAGRINFINTSLLNTTGTGTLLDITGAGSALIEFVKCVIDGWGSVGMIDTANLTIFRSCDVTNNGTGITMSNIFAYSFQSLLFNNAVDNSGTFISMTGAGNLFGEVRNSGLFTNANESAIFIDSASTTSLGVTVTENQYGLVGSFFDPAGLDETDVRMKVKDNVGQKDSKMIGSFNAKNNTTATSIPSSGTFVDLNLGGLASPSSNIERWTLNSTTTGELEYIGREQFTGLLAATVTVSKSGGGGAQSFNFKALKNGADMVDNIEITEEVKNETDSFALVIPTTAVTGDLIKLQVENPTSTVDILIEAISVNIQ